MDGVEWMKCEMIRYINRNECVVRLHGTGAHLHLALTQPLDASRACLVSALRTAPAKVMVGQYVGGIFHQSVIEIEFPVVGTDMPSPRRYVRKVRLNPATHKPKRRRVGPE
jgi:hypothetical protein